MTTIRPILQADSRLLARGPADGQVHQDSRISPCIALPAHVWCSDIMVNSIPAVQDLQASADASGCIFQLLHVACDKLKLYSNSRTWLQMQLNCQMCHNAAQSLLHLQLSAAFTSKTASSHDHSTIHLVMVQLEHPVSFSDIWSRGLCIAYLLCGWRLLVQAFTQHVHVMVYMG